MSYISNVAYYQKFMRERDSLLLLNCIVILMHIIHHNYTRILWLIQGYCSFGQEVLTVQETWLVTDCKCVGTFSKNLKTHAKHQS